jgi:hypothetical protein
MGSFGCQMYLYDGQAVNKKPASNKQAFVLCSVIARSSSGEQFRLSNYKWSG